MDILFAIGIFLVLLLLSLSLSRLAEQRSLLSSERADMELKAQLAMDTLLLTSGNPGNWDTNGSFSSLGLVTEGDYILDIHKVQAFEQRNSTYVNTSLALGIAGYQNYVHVMNASGTIYSFGISPPYTVHDVVIVQRLAVLDTLPVTVEVGVWQ